MRKLFAIGLVLFLSSAAFAMGGDPANGEKVFRKCKACHVADAATNKIGPHLVGIVDRPIASIENYRYSRAMISFSRGKIWDEALLSQYLTAPTAIVRGTRMAFAGLRKPQDVADILAYLKSVGEQ